MRNGFCIDFGLHLVPFEHHFEMEMGKKNKKIAPEPASKNKRFFEWFFDRFFDDFGFPNGVVFHVPGRPKSYLSFRMGHLRSSWPFCTHFWSIFDRFGIKNWSFGIHLGSIFADLSSKFGALGFIWETFLRIWDTIFDTSIQVRCSRFRFRFRILNQISRFRIQDSKPIWDQKLEPWYPKSEAFLRILNS